MEQVVSEIESLVERAVFDPDDHVRERSQQAIRELAATRGIFHASIQGLYEAAGQGLYSHVTVPAINIRGLTYHVARAVFRAALKHSVGAFIFEIARSEIGYTEQRPAEYSTAVLGAALASGYAGPVFVQGDHFQVNAKKYKASPDDELGTIRNLIVEAIDAGFFNIDIDSSTLVDLSKPTEEVQQETNAALTHEFTTFIRDKEPDGVIVSIGGVMMLLDSVVRKITSITS